jgi:predicted membrane-bound spermidine synthase
MQHLNIFLGHPTYGLPVVLFTVLLASGAGSLVTQTRWARETPNAAGYLLGALLLVLLSTGLVTSSVLDAFRGESNAVRIGISALLLLPMGLLMGMPFPLGMRLGAREHESLTPWFWGVNGATTVCASVLAMAIALFFGFEVDGPASAASL